MTESAVRNLAAKIVDEHGAGSGDYITARVRDVLEYPVTVDDWGRVAAVVNTMLHPDRYWPISSSTDGRRCD